MILLGEDIFSCLGLGLIWVLFVEYLFKVRVK
jgi:hypothetical protein